eukprot:6376992-Amphidinium_carterae.1
MLCFVCGLPRESHAGRRFCISKKDKGAGKASRTKGKSKGKQPQTPPAPPAASACSLPPAPKQ